MCCMWDKQLGTKIAIQESCPPPFSNSLIPPSQLPMAGSARPPALSAPWLPSPRPGALTIEAQVKEVPKSKVILHDGHERRHLAEKQHAVISRSQFWQNTIKQLKLSRGPIQLSPEPKNAKQEDRITAVFLKDPGELHFSYSALHSEHSANNCGMNK